MQVLRGALTPHRKSSSQRRSRDVAPVLLWPTRGLPSRVKVFDADCPSKNSCRVQGVPGTYLTVDL